MTGGGRGGKLTLLIGGTLTVSVVVVSFGGCNDNNKKKN